MPLTEKAILKPKVANFEVGDDEEDEMDDEEDGGGIGNSDGDSD